MNPAQLHIWYSSLLGGVNCDTVETDVINDLSDDSISIVDSGPILL